MSEPAVWVLSLITFTGVAGIATVTVVILSRGVARTGGSATTVATVTVVAAVLMGALFAAGTAFAAAGGYQVPDVDGVPWLPVAFVVIAGGLLLLTMLPIVARALRAPEMAPDLIRPHQFRLVGFAFIAALLFGVLPPVFAIPAGVGDIAISIAAPFVARRLAQGRGRRGAVWFNILGLTDLVLALSLGALAAYGLIPGASDIQAITDLPLVLIPTFGVPILFAVHIRSLIALVRLRGADNDAGALEEPL